jgi:putative acetyltransferase
MTSEAYQFNIAKLSDIQDLEDVMQIWIEGSKTAHAFIEPAYWLKHTTAMREVYLPQSETWIYKDVDGKVAGFLSLVDNLLPALFVHPAKQGNGIGSTLMQWAKKLKNELHLTVYTKNVRAVAFYQQHCFEIKRQQVDVNTGEMEFYMEWVKDKR